MTLPLDIYRVIFNYSSFIIKIRLRQVNNELYDNLWITDLCYEPTLIQLVQLTDDIIHQHSHIESLFIYLNYNINISKHSYIKHVINGLTIKIYNRNIQDVYDLYMWRSKFIKRLNKPNYGTRYYDESTGFMSVFGNTKEDYNPISFDEFKLHCKIIKESCGISNFEAAYCFTEYGKGDDVYTVLYYKTQ